MPGRSAHVPSSSRSSNSAHSDSRELANSFGMLCLWEMDGVYDGLDGGGRGEGADVVMVIGTVGVGFLV